VAEARASAAFFVAARGERARDNTELRLQKGTNGGGIFGVVPPSAVPPWWRQPRKTGGKKSAAFSHKIRNYLHKGGRRCRYHFLPVFQTEYDKKRKFVKNAQSTHENGLLTIQSVDMYANCVNFLTFQVQSASFRQNRAKSY